LKARAKALDSSQRRASAVGEAALPLVGVPQRGGLQWMRC
jgi:hypothetical protein